MSDILKGCAIHKDSSKQQIEERLGRVFEAPYTNELKVSKISGWLYQSEETASLVACSKCEVCFYQITLMKGWLEKQIITKKDQSDDDTQKLINSLTTTVQSQSELIKQYSSIVDLELKNKGTNNISCCAITKTFNQSFIVMKNNFGQVDLEAKMNVFAIVTFFLTNPSIENNLCKNCVKYLGGLEGILEELRRDIAISKKTTPQPKATEIKTENQNSVPLNDAVKRYNSSSQPQNRPPENQKKESKRQAPPKWTGADWKQATQEERIEWFKQNIDYYGGGHQPEKKNVWHFDNRPNYQTLTFELKMENDNSKGTFEIQSFLKEEGNKPLFVNPISLEVTYPKEGSSMEKQKAITDAYKHSITSIINWIIGNKKENIHANIITPTPPRDCWEDISKSLEFIKEKVEKRNITFILFHSDRLTN